MLPGSSPARGGKVPNASAAVMDSQSIKTTEEGGGSNGYDVHKNVKGRKRHLLVDTLGMPLSICVTPVDVQDRPERACCLLDCESAGAPPEEDQGGLSLLSTGTSRAFSPRRPGTRGGEEEHALGCRASARRRHSARSNPRKRSNSFARQMARTKKNQTATAPMIAAVMNQGFVRTPK
jgi:hypothetical protein